MDLSAYQANYQPFDIGDMPPRASAAPKKGGGFGGILANLLPTIGGGVGSVAGGIAGTAVAPVVGTAAGVTAGGSVGSGLGEYLRQKLTGEAEDGIDKGNIVQEAGFGALPGVFKGAKAIKGAVTAGKAVDTATDVSKAALAAQSTEEALMARKGLTDTSKRMVQRTSDRLIGDSTGIKPGAKVGSRTLTAKRAGNLNEHIKMNLGTKPTDAADTVLRRNEAFIDGTAAELNSVLEARNMPLKVSDYSEIANAVKKPIGLNLKNNPTQAELLRDFSEVKDIRGLEDFRRKIDDVVNFARSEASPDPVNERIGLAWRKSIDKFVTDRVPETKPLKDALSKAYDTRTYIEPAARNPRGANIFGVRVGGRALQSGQRATATGLDKINDAIAPAGTGGGAMPFVGQAAKASLPQAGYRAGGAAFGVPFVGGEQPDEAPLPAEDVAMDDMADPSLMQPASAETDTASSPFAPENIESSIQKILANGGDMKAVSEFMNIAKTMQALQPEATPPKKTEAMRARDEAADLTSTALQQFAGGSVDTGFIPSKVQGVREFFGQGDQETIEFNTTISALRGAIAKARAGTAMSPGEKKLLDQYTPKPGDTGQQLRTKLAALQDVFATASEREAGSDYSPSYVGL